MAQLLPGTAPPPWLYIAIVLIALATMPMVGLLLAPLWQRLKKHYLCLSPPQGEVFANCGISLQSCNFNGCVYGIIAAEGIYLKIWPIFNLAGRPVLVPFSALGPGDLRSLLGARFYATTVRLPDGYQMRLRFNGRWAEPVQRAHQQYLARHSGQNPFS